MKDSHDRLREARLAAGFSSIAEAARRKNLHKQNLADHEAGRRGIGAEHAQDYGRAFKVRPEWILFGVESDSVEVPVVGYVGAGAEANFYDDHEKGAGLEMVVAPPGCPADAIAVMIRGESMYPAYFDGDILFYDTIRADIETFLNKQCVCRLADGRTVVKTPVRGSAPGLFTLTSFNAPPIPDVVVEWCAKIEWIKKR